MSGDQVQVIGRVSEDLSIMLTSSATATNSTLSRLVETGINSVISLGDERLAHVAEIAEPFRGRAQLIARIDPDLKKEARHWALDNEMTLTDIIRLGSVMEVGRCASSVGVLVEKLRVDFPEMFYGEAP
jgi:hypothetical protein